MEAFQRRREEIVARYDAAFSQMPELQPPTVRDDVESAHHLYVLRLVQERLNISRDDFIRALADLGVTASVHFIPIHVHPYYRDTYGYRPDDFPVAWNAFQRMLSLPLYSRMADEDVDHVIGAVEHLVRSHRR
jgi:dTDP-4-amino-4,6-dideoxygalactose transaminase